LKFPPSDVTSSHTVNLPFDAVHFFLRWFFVLGFLLISFQDAFLHHNPRRHLLQRL